ncbi:FAD/NAD(P)-binding domain-containing protein [Mycena rebaudengoi]|nr:FAD/NAD(P)-binding domain-containing protein [Mycena rebaudengoi]
MVSLAPSTQPLNVSILFGGVDTVSNTSNQARSRRSLSVQVNSLRVLRHLGISKEDLKGVDLKGVVVYDSKGTTGVTVPFAEEKHENLLCLRNDLHEALLRVAGGEEFEGPPAKLHLGSRVVACDVEEGNIILDNGRVVHADLILAADGMNSGLRTEVLGQLHKSIPSGFTVFRSIFDAARLGPDMGWVTDGLPGTRMVMANANEEKHRMVALSTCSGGSVVNIVGLHEDSHQADPEEFKSFNPKFQSLIGLVDKDVIKFQLRSVPLLHIWVAAGTGAGRSDVPARLAAFQTLRKERDEFVNIDSLEQVTIPAKRGTFAKSREMQAYILEYDAIKAAQECYQEHFGGQQ